MTEHIRYEYRTFGVTFTTLRESLAQQLGYDPETIPVSRLDEIYFISPLPSVSIKLRSNALEINRQTEIESDGLERWEETENLSIPVSTDYFGQILNRMGMPELPTFYETMDETTLLDILSASGYYSYVFVHKERRQFELEGVHCEYTLVQTGSCCTLSFAMDHPEAAKLRQLKNKLDLNSRQNTSYMSYLMREYVATDSEMKHGDSYAPY